MIKEGGGPNHPYNILQRRQNHRPYRSSLQRLFKMLPFLGSLIYRSIKYLWRKVRFIFWLERPRKTADPILPVRNPTRSISNDPLLVEGLVISSPCNGSPADSTLESTSAAIVDLEEVDRELQCDSVDFMSSQQWPEEICTADGDQMDRVIVSIPDFTCSLSLPSASEEIVESAIIVEEIAPERVPSPEESMVGKSSAEEEEVVVVKSTVVVHEERWIKHYSSRQRILLVGDGDFSFSACLAVAFGCASNMIATSLDSEEFLKKNYKKAASNLEELRTRAVMVMHGIDATEMAKHALLGHFRFDRVIFNFPFAGFFKNFSRDAQLRRHRTLVCQFLKNAKEMIDENGEIHISHKTNGFHAEWNLEAVASSHRLRLIDAVPFRHLDYPRYRSKYGFGGDNNFNCNPSKTYKFGLRRACY